MNQILTLLRGRLDLVEGDTDQRLLDRFLVAQDEVAFAELVHRHGRVVWGVCRRQLANRQDTEDAFQATFLVLVRRASRLGPDVPLGPWLYRVAAMTARNIQRGNRRRVGVSGPMEHEVPAPSAEPVAERLDIDRALLALPERYREPVVLCHLQGLTRREAAARLGCPEGTLSARLHRALARLRSLLGDRGVAVLATAGTMVVPTELQAATVRMAVVFSTSTLTAVGVSPAVAGLTDGVLRMFWMKKVAAMLALAVLVTVGLVAGFAARSGGIAQATASLADQPQAPPEDPNAALKRLNREIEELRRQREMLGAKELDLFAQMARIEEAKTAKGATVDVGNDLAIVVTEGGRGLGWSKPPYTIREVINGKLGEMQCYELDILKLYLSRAFKDPEGPKKLRIYADQNWSHDQVFKLFAACGAAGYRKALFILPEAPWIVSGLDWKTGKAEKVERGEKEAEIDLTKYAPRKP